MANTKDKLAQQLRQHVAGLILAGGQGRRMQGQDKGLINYSGIPMIQHGLQMLEKSLDTIVISANRNLDTYRKFGCLVVTDGDHSYSGPLAGISQGLQHLTTPYCFVMPCDAPYLDTHVLQRLFTSLIDNQYDIAVAELDGKPEPVIMLMKTNLLSSLQRYRELGGHRVSDWVLGQHTLRVDFSDNAQWFANINSPQDKVQLI